MKRLYPTEQTIERTDEFIMSERIAKTGLMMSRGAAKRRLMTWAAKTGLMKCCLRLD